MFYVTFQHLNIEEIKTMMTINTPTRAELRHNGIIKQNEPRKQRTAGKWKVLFYHFSFYLQSHLQESNGR